VTAALQPRSFALDGPLAAWDNFDESGLARDRVTMLRTIVSAQRVSLTGGEAMTRKAVDLS